MTPIEDQIRHFWGEQLKPITLPAHIGPVLPRETVLFLENVGLPQDRRLEEDHALHLKFDQAFSELQTLPVEQTDYVLIGERVWRSYSHNVRLSKVGLRGGDGELYFLHYRQGDQFNVHLANSSVQQFLACAAIWLAVSSDLNKYFPMRFGKSAKVRNEDKREEEVGRQGILEGLTTLKEEIRSIDPKALNKERNGFWIETLFDLEQATW